jgi:hypothetical protein
VVAERGAPPEQRVIQRRARVNSDGEQRDADPHCHDTDPLIWAIRGGAELDGYPSSVIVVLRLGAVRADQLAHEQVSDSADRADPYFHFHSLRRLRRLGHGEGPPPTPVNDNDH